MRQIARGVKTASFTTISYMAKFTNPDNPALLIS